VEIFGWNFSANDYSSPQFIALSSAALVTAARRVQVCVLRAQNGGSFRAAFL
jgi:hypothetical protein